MKPESEKTRRLFLALWPDDALRRELESLQRQCVTAGRIRQGVRVPAANLHITLHFIGAVAPETVRPLRESLSQVRADPFCLALDCFGLFRRPGIVWFGPSHIPAGMLELVTATRAGIEQHTSLRREKRYRPHVTLFRKAGQPCGIEITQPLEWPVEQFALVESLTHPEGARYSVLQQWRLQGEASN